MKKIVLRCGREFCKYRYLGGRIIVEQSNVEIALRFNKVKEVEN